MKYIIETKTDDGFHKYEYIYSDLGQVSVGDVISLILQTKDAITRKDYKVLQKRIADYCMKEANYVDVNLFCKELL